MKNQFYIAEMWLKAQYVIRDSGIEIITSISLTFSLGIWKFNVYIPLPFPKLLRQLQISNLIF